MKIKGGDKGTLIKFSQLFLTHLFPLFPVTMPSNSGAWLVAKQVHPLEVKSAPYTTPGDHEILVKNAAWAINPADWAMQSLGFLPLDYPIILGADLAGEVVEAGNAVTRFKKGDRVLAFALGLVGGAKSEGAFQEYTVVQPRMASIIPDSLSFEQAAVLPLCVATAAGSLYQKDHLNLQHPSLDPKPNGQILLVWGGASSVGSNAIQLAVASGYEVVTTASAKNFDYVKKLGASQVFDYSEPSVIDDIVSALDGKPIVGVLDAVNSNGAIEKSIEAASRLQGNKFVSTVRNPPENLPDGVKAKFVFSKDIKDNEVSKVIYEDYLPQALAQGKYVAAPDAHIVGKGLESVQAGIDMINSMSAKKVVITA
ncbi:MAG: hypothetical protein L6R40_006038 [Gallowayella cf. fulva]|nr:MAG: hypothetical protein L6R40_006038 [Xanthomendoza cf. fulva]